MSQSADLSKNIAIVPKELSIYVQGTCNIIHVKAPFVYQASRNVYYKHIILFCECKCQRVKTYCFNIKKKIIVKHAQVDLVYINTKCLFKASFVRDDLC